MNRSLIVAHRGASADAPENTLAAFDLAWKQAADAIEGDFRLTADGHIICCHDPEVVTAAGRRLAVAESKLDEVRRVRGRGPGGRSALPVQMPLLEEVLVTVPHGKQVFIELKCGREIIEPLLQVMESSPLERHQMTVISFQEDVIRSFKERAPDVHALWITEVKLGLRGRLSPSADAVLQVLRRTGAGGVSCGANPFLSRRFMQAIREAGFEFHVWTVDSARAARYFLNRGAMSITTNRPGHVIKKLER